MTPDSDLAAIEFTPGHHTITQALATPLDWNVTTERQSALCERLGFPGDWFSRPIEGPTLARAMIWLAPDALALALEEPTVEPTPEAAPVVVWVVDAAEAPVVVPVEPDPPAKPKRRARRTGHKLTYEEHLDSIREILIDRLDTILMAKIDEICGRWGLDNGQVISVIQDVQLALVPEEFGEPGDPAGMVPAANPTPNIDSLWKSRVGMFAGFLATVTDRKRRTVEGRLPVPTPDLAA